MLAGQLDLFGGVASGYPNSPGYKERTTSKEAADAIAPSAGVLREAVLRALAKKAMTPDQTARFLGESVLSIRPRFTELAASKRIVRTGLRHKNKSGRMAHVYMLNRDIGA